MSPPPDPEQSGDDPLQAWLDQLAGHSTGADPGLHALRAAIHAHAQAQTDQLLGDAAGPQAQALAVDRLRRRLQQQRRWPAPQRRPWWRRLGMHLLRPLPTAGLATAALLFVAGLAWQWQWQAAPPADGEGAWPVSDGEAPTYRGAVVPLQQVEDKPQQAAQRLARQLASAGAVPTLHREGANLVLDVVVPADRVQAVRAAVADPGLAAGLQAGLNRIVVVPRP